MARVPVQFFHDPLGGSTGMLPPVMDGRSPELSAHSLCCLASDGTVWRRVYPLGQQCRWEPAERHPSGVPSIPPLPQPEPEPEDHPAADFEPGKILRVRRQADGPVSTARFDAVGPAGGVYAAVPEGEPEPGQWLIAPGNWWDPAG